MARFWKRSPASNGERESEGSHLEADVAVAVHPLEVLHPLLHDRLLQRREGNSVTEAKAPPSAQRTEETQ